MKWKNNFVLLLTAIIWGCALVAQSAGTEYVGPWTFNCLRSFIGGITLLLLMPFINKVRHVDTKSIQLKPAIIGGIACGIALASASMFQQSGITEATAGKAGFLSSLYVIFVPIIGLFIGKKTRFVVWIGALVALVGFYFLSLSGSFTLQRGDFLLLICAVLFAIHILVINHFNETADGVMMSCVQFFVAGIVCSVGMFLFEEVQLSAIMDAIVSIVYSGCLSSGIGFTFQIVGQNGVDPTIASMILGLESVFAAIAGFLILHESLSPREIFGCLLIFVAICIAQFPERTQEKLVSEK